MRSPNRPRPNEPRPNERGAALVEGALIAPLFFLLVFAIFEFGLVFRTYLLTTSAASAGGRTATVAANGRDADFLILRGIEHEMGADNLERLNKVVVYKADGPGAQVPAPCLSVPPPLGSECNQYSPTDFFASYVDSGGKVNASWGCGNQALDRRWCPLDRQTKITADGGPDYLGVYVEVEHQYISGLFGGSRTISVDRVVRIEPS